MVEGTQGSPQAMCGCVSVGRLSQKGHGRERKAASNKAWLARCQILQRSHRVKSAK